MKRITKALAAVCGIALVVFSIVNHLNGVAVLPALILCAWGIPGAIINSKSNE